MRKLLLLFTLAAVAFAQNVSGSWQGTLQVPQGPKLRLVFKISRADDESLKAVMYSIDQNGQSVNATSATLQSGTLKIAFGGGAVTYEGKLTGDSIAGTFTQGAPMPLTLVRATPATAWAIPEAPAPPKPMAAGADPSFDVATIKPSDPAEQGWTIRQGNGGANVLTTVNTTLADLIAFAYNVHARQVTGGPSWMDSDKFDITAKPDTPGIPSMPQMQTMLKKLLADRFQLALHHDKKELSVYVLTAAKTGPKVAKSQSTGKVPGIAMTGPRTLGVMNCTMTEFAQFLPIRVLNAVDRPVVDQTGLTDRYDFQLKWTPDNAGAAAPGPDDPPDLFTAVQQQLGLKLEAVRTPVDVLVIDKAEKPSAN
jgi:uncharacterized protein (TIGR03435 family)